MHEVAFVPAVVPDEVEFGGTRLDGCSIVVEGVVDSGTIFEIFAQ